MYNVYAEARMSLSNVSQENSFCECTVLDKMALCDGFAKSCSVADPEGGAAGAPPPLKFDRLVFFSYPILYQTA